MDQQQIQQQQKKLDIGEFKMGKLLGQGAYARVYHCKLKASGVHFAVKVMEKKFIIKEKKIAYVNMERKILSDMDHPFIMGLYFSFHDNEHLYMVIDLCRGGELSKLIRYHREKKDDMMSMAVSSSHASASASTTAHLSSHSPALLPSSPKAAEASLNGSARKSVSFHQQKAFRALPVEDARFYFAETLCAIQYLHSKSIVHRDIKPENILITDTGHIKLTDFGTAKDESTIDQQQQQDSKGTRRDTFCGTADYVSPEVLRDKPSSIPADLWAMGCLLYSMIIGKPPFRAESEYMTFQKILEHSESSPVEFPATAVDTNPELENMAIDLINLLLKPNPESRIGIPASSILEHPFLKTLDAPLDKLKAPKLPYTSSLSEPNIDGASDEWLFDEDDNDLLTQELSTSQNSRTTESTISQVGNGTHASTKRTSTIGSSVHAPMEMSTVIDQSLNQGEKVLVEGLVVKRTRSGLITRTRHLVLTDKPRLMYYDPVRLVLRGEIPFSKDPSKLNVTLRSDGKSFDIYTPERTYHLRDVMGSAARWASGINSMRGR